MKYSTDVVVVGSGCGGTSAGYHCSNAGLNTLLVEADSGFGKAIGGAKGAALSGVNGIFAVESDYQKSKHFRDTKKEAFKFLMEHSNWSVDARQVSAFVGRSASIWHWLEGLGAAAEEAVAYNWTSPHTWLYFDDTKPRLELVGQAFLNAGGKLFDNAIFEEIIINDGKAAGIKGKMTDDTPFEIEAKTVILAFGEPGPISGGKAMGPMMGGPVVEKPDGFKIAEKAGVGRMGNTKSALAMMAKPEGVGGPGDPNEPQEAYIRQPEELAVNLYGERFTTEEILGTMEDGASAIAIQKNGTAFIVFDTNINKHFCDEGWTSTKYRYGNEGPAYKDLDARLLNAINAGFDSIYMADSIEKLGKKMGVDTDAFVKTVDDYNKCCLSGRDHYFYKDRDYLIPLLGPRYYAIKVEASLNEMNGVLKSNHRLELLNEKDESIPGLYGAGGCISFLNGSIYTHHTAGSRSTFGLVCGQMLGEIVPEYVKKQ